MHIDGGFYNAGSVGKGAEVSLTGKSFRGGGKTCIFCPQPALPRGEEKSKAAPSEIQEESKK